MKNDNFKMLVAQLNPVPMDIEYNKNKILEVCKNIQDDIKLVIFPENFIYGSDNYDVLKKFPYILNQINSALDDISREITTNILVGSIEKIDNKYKNSFSLISNNQIKNVENFEIENIKFDILSKDKVLKENIKKDSDILICPINSISRTNNEYFKNKALKEIAISNNKKLLYINQIGAQDCYVYDGMSRFYNQSGEIVSMAKAFEEDMLEIDINNGGRIERISKEFFETSNLNKFELNYENDLERTYKSIVLAIKDYFSKNGFTQAVLGLSGGLDSTICATLVADAIGAKNVLGVSMPSKLTSSESKNDAKELATNLGINFIETEIKEYHDLFSKNFDGIFNQVSEEWCNRYTKSFTQDNIQARSRAMILFGIANEFGSTLSIATSDKSEFYMGYATINGDMSGGFAPISDVTKTKLFALASWMNENREVKNAIPKSIILKPPGAELAIDPNTGKTLRAEDALMPYEFLDEVIWRIENLHQSIHDMMQFEFIYEKKNSVDSTTKKAWLEKFFKRMNNALYKWCIVPPGPIVDAKSINKIEYNQPIVSNINYLK